jgi:LuxR family maltose regulon positive regulatory protein
VDIALSSDLRAAALMNLGAVEAWSLARQDAERHRKEGAVLAREIGRPFGLTGSRELLAALPRHETARAALLADILDVMRGASLMPEDLSVPPQAGQLSPGELRVLRYLPTNLSRPEIAAELSVSVNTVSTHIRSSYDRLGADDRSAAVRRARDLRLLAAVRS